MEEIEELIVEESKTVPYKPVSKGISLDVHVPRNMEYELQMSLNEVEKTFGNIDLYVQKKLRYEVLSELYAALTAEQIDAVALSIANIERGEGIVIGDMTGIGKGRIAAAIIRYACLSGYHPVFITEKANLFSDLYRDLKGINSTRFTPLIINNDPEADIKDYNPRTEQLEVIHKHHTADALRMRIEDEHDLPEGYHFVCATYSQFNQDYPSAWSRAMAGKGVKPKAPGKSQYKADFLREIAQNNILVLDEAHNAGGSDSTIGYFLRECLEKSMGAVYLSATFAKRPDNLPLYAVKTVMKEANLNGASLVSAIINGGTAMQEIIATNLVEAGQMVRRERTFQGIKITYNELPHLKSEHSEIFDAIVLIVQNIIDFQTKYIKPMIKNLDKQVREEEGAGASETSGTSLAGVDNCPFVSKVFNVIDQLLFAIKANAVADEAIEALRQNKKPVIAFKSTMGSFLADMGFDDGDFIESTDFSLSLEKGLRSVMKFTVRNAKGVSSTRFMEVYELSLEGQKVYYDILNQISNTSSGISISPIDVIISRIEAAGYRVGEITGRKQRIRFDQGGKTGTIESYKVKKNEIFNSFNNAVVCKGDAARVGAKPPGSKGVDVVLLNQSGATGASLHASEAFNDQRTRFMIIHQIELNVNIEVQKRGRVNRTGQVVKPEYRYVCTSIPAERRLMMMMKSKMKSLDANTSGNQKNTEEALKSEDFLNKYGDDVVLKFLDENEEWNALLLNPFSSEKEGEGRDNAANKVTGRVAILPTLRQEEFYKEILERYHRYITNLKQNDAYDLETTYEKLDADTISKNVLIAGSGGRSAFGKDSILEYCVVNKLRKPYTKQELDQALEKAMDGRSPREISKGMVAQYSEFFPQHIERKLAIGRAKIIEIEERITEAEFSGNESKVLKLTNDLNMETKLLATREERLHNSAKQLLENMEFFSIGRVLNVPTDNAAKEGSEFSKGVFLGFEINTAKENPYSPSAVIMHIATLDGRRKITPVCSDYAFINAMVGKSYNMSARDTEETLRFWDKTAAGNVREHKYIITGNLLQGLGHTYGKLIKFNTKKGEFKNGIRLPESFGKEEANFETVIPILKMLPRIESLGLGESLITQGGEVKFAKKNFDFYEIRIPSAQNKGGIYYLDEGLRALISKSDPGTDLGTFVKIGQEMQAALHRNNLKAFVEILHTKFRLMVKVDAEVVTDEPDKPGNKEFIYKLSKPFGAGSYPPFGFLRQMEGGEFGMVVYDRNLEIKVRLTFSLIPVFPNANEAVGEWMKSLSPIQSDQLEKLIKNKLGSPKFLSFLGDFIASTNIIGNQEFTLGDYTDKELSQALSEIKNLNLNQSASGDLNFIIRQLESFFDFVKNSKKNIPHEIESN